MWTAPEKESSAHSLNTGVILFLTFKCPSKANKILLNVY